MLPRATSQVFDAAEALRDLLIAATWPAGGLGGADPQVGMSEVDPSRTGEFVQVVPVVGEDSSIEWVSAPSRRSESFALEVRIVTNIGAPTETAAVERIKELTQVVERTLFDDVTGTLVTLTEQQESNLTASQVSFEVGEFDSGEFGAVATVVAGARFRI